MKTQEEVRKEAAEVADNESLWRKETYVMLHNIGDRLIHVETNQMNSRDKIDSIQTNMDNLQSGMLMIAKGKTHELKVAVPEAKTPAIVQEEVVESREEKNARIKNELTLKANDFAMKNKGKYLSYQQLKRELKWSVMSGTDRNAWLNHLVNSGVMIQRVIGLKGREFVYEMVGSTRIAPAVKPSQVMPNCRGGRSLPYNSGLYLKVFGMPLYRRIEAAYTDLGRALTKDEEEKLVNVLKITLQENGMKFTTRNRWSILSMFSVFRR